MTTAEILAKIPELAVLVVGDICLDRWCAYGPATAEPSRETGIPRIGVVSTEVTLGAGGTIANNLVALGAGRVAVMGAVGDDGSGYELTRALCARGIDFGMLVRAPGLQTFTYTKLINGDNGV
ncbi:MAG: ribokinase, partial [Bryobacteraceae bacterium]|nr:ribokinase [Bryobacteraceae bacterium]